MSSARIEEMLRQAGLDPDEATDLVDVLVPLESLVRETPAPSADLEDLLCVPGPVAPPASLDTRRRGRPRATLAGAVVLAVAGVGATGLSAAANTLPRPWQRQVAHFSQHYLPFDLPEPTKHATGPDGSTSSTGAPRDETTGQSAEHPGGDAPDGEPAARTGGRHPGADRPGREHVRRASRSVDDRQGSGQDNRQGSGQRPHTSSVGSTAWTESPSLAPGQSSGQSSGSGGWGHHAGHHAGQHPGQSGQQTGSQPRPEPDENPGEQQGDDRSQGGGTGSPDSTPDSKPGKAGQQPGDSTGRGPQDLPQKPHPGSPTPIVLPDLPDLPGGPDPDAGLGAEQ